MEVQGVARPGRRQGSGRSSRLFTLEHAHRTLPLVRRIVADVVKCHKRICALEAKCQLPVPRGKEDEIEELRYRYGQELDRLRALSEEVSAIGCRLKDFHRGIVDYRALYQGRVIEFCWRHGEKSIQFWHELDDGFHDRREIDDAFVAEIAAEAEALSAL